MRNNNNNRPPRKCKSEAQKRAIRKSYAIRGKKKENEQLPVAEPPNPPKPLPTKFPFWARLKISKRRTTLVIDEDKAMDKQKHKLVDGYVHREATHTNNKDYEEIKPNPDPTDSRSMYLKRPQKLPKRLFEPHNKDLNMPEHLQQLYDKNNHKNDKTDK